MHALSRRSKRGRLQLPAPSYFCCLSRCCSSCRRAAAAAACSSAAWAALAAVVRARVASSRASEGESFHASTPSYCTPAAGRAGCTCGQARARSGWARMRALTGRHALVCASWAGGHVGCRPSWAKSVYWPQPCHARWRPSSYDQAASGVCGPQSTKQRAATGGNILACMRVCPPGEGGGGAMGTPAAASRVGAPLPAASPPVAALRACSRP